MLLNPVKSRARKKFVRHTARTPNRRGCFPDTPTPARIIRARVRRESETNPGVSSRLAGGCVGRFARVLACKTQHRRHGVTSPLVDNDRRRLLRRSRVSPRRVLPERPVLLQIMEGRRRRRRKCHLLRALQRRLARVVGEGS